MSEWKSAGTAQHTEGIWRVYLLDMSEHELSGRLGGVMFSESEQRALEKADLIVRAVNAHAGLVEALDTLTGAMESMAAEGQWYSDHEIELFRNEGLAALKAARDDS